MNAAGIGILKIFYVKTVSVCFVNATGIGIQRHKPERTGLTSGRKIELGFIIYELEV